MAKADKKTAEKLKKLERKMKKIANAAEGVKPKKKKLLMSPLAPEAFPDLPPVVGVRFATAEAGIRYRNRKDLLAVHLAPGTSVAGLLTKSATRASCVVDVAAKLKGAPKSDEGAVFVVNSGNANAFTGARGAEIVTRVSEAAAEAIKVPVDRVFTASTGVIGEPFDARLITDALPAMAGDLAQDGAGDAWEDAARAIMTTDTFPKGSGRVVELSDGPIRISGIAKGSGMIAPDMATMLAYIFTDATIPPGPMQRMLSRLADDTFNAITVDGDTSTSDQLLMAATGTAPNKPIRDLRSRDGRLFMDALGEVMEELAHLVVRDGEGATKFVEIEVSGAKSHGDAHKVAMSVANSPLVKTAIAGADPNWGRIVAAVGKSGAVADRDLLTIRFGDLIVAQNGERHPDYDEEIAADYMKNTNIQISIDLGLGKFNRTVWTCDLTHGYIDINADYRS